MCTEQNSNPKKDIITCKGGSKQEVAYKGRPIRMMPDFSVETLKAIGDWVNVLQTRSYRWAAIRINNRKRNIHDKTKFKQFLSWNPTSQKTLEGKPQSEEVNYTQDTSNLKIANQKSCKNTHTTTTN